MSKPKNPTNVADSGTAAKDAEGVGGKLSQKPYSPERHVTAMQAGPNEYLESLKRSYAKLGIEPVVFDGIPVDINLDMEIRISRAQQLRFIKMLGEGIEWVYSDPLTKELRPLDDGEFQALKGTRSVLSVEQLLQQSLGMTRAMLATKADIAPGEHAAANVHIKLTVAGDVSQREPFPVLDVEDPEEVETTYSAAPAAPSKKPDSWDD